MLQHLSPMQKYPREARRAPSHHLPTAAANPALDGFPLEAVVKKALNAKRGWEEEII